MRIEPINILFLIIIQISFMQDISSYLYIPFLLLFVFSLLPFYREEITISKKQTIIFLLLVVYFSCSIIFYNNYDYLTYPEIYSLSISLLVYYLLFSIYKNRINDLKKIIDYLLLFNVVFFFFQYILYIVSGYYIDPISWITGIPARFHYNVAGWNIIRATGLSNEPGSYSTYVIPLLFLSYLLNGKIKKKHILTVISLILSFSTFAIIYAILFVVITCRNYLKKNPILILSLLLLFSVIVYFLFYDYIMFRFFSDNDDGSLRSKMYALTFLQDANFERLILGSGFAYNDCNCLIADNTMYFSLFYTFGVSSLLFFSGLIYFFRKNKDVLLLTSVLMLSKLLIFYPIVWVYISVISIIRYRNK